MKDPAVRFYVHLLTIFENPHEGIIRIDVEVLPHARKLSEFATRKEAEAFAESAAVAFQTAGMIVVYDPE